MALETPVYINTMTSTNPTASDPKSEGDDHIRNIKSAVKATFPNVTGAVTPTHTELNTLAGIGGSTVATQLALKLNAANPTFTGTLSVGSAAITEAELEILDGATLTTTELNYVDGVTSAIQTQLNAKAALAAPVFTGAMELPVTAKMTSFGGVVFMVDSANTGAGITVSTSAASGIATEGDIWMQYTP